MMKFTQEQFNQMASKGTSHIYFQKGNYSNINSFPDKSIFDEECVFSPQSTFGSFTIFGEGCVFGKQSNFGSFIIFGENCHTSVRSVFGDYAVFSKNCSIGSNSKIGSYCSLSNGCVLGSNVEFIDKPSFKPKCMCEFGMFKDLILVDVNNETLYFWLLEDNSVSVRQSNFVGDLDSWKSYFVSNNYNYEHYKRILKHILNEFKLSNVSV